MKKIKLLCILLAVFLVVSVLLISLEHFVFRVQYPEAFVYNGMPLTDFYDAMGRSGRNVGYGEVILEYDLEDGRTLHVTLSKDYANGMTSIVTNCWIEPGGDPSMNRWILPMILAAVALIEVVVYTIIILTRRKRMRAVE